VIDHAHVLTLDFHDEHSSFVGRRYPLPRGGQEQELARIQTDMKHFLPLVALAGLGLLPLTGKGVDDAGDAGKTPGHLTINDAEFVRTAAQGGMTEVKLGELAALKGKREDVKRFGELMVTDHTKINDTLKSFALLKGITLQDQLDATHAGVVDRISTLEGDQFEKAYIDEMVKDHKKDLGEFQEEAKAVKDPELKALVAKALPIFKQHLQHIEKVANGNP
jgi:putative membrane protein